MTAIADSTLPDSGERLENKVVERIYDVALDPLKYGDLLDIWEELVGPERRRALNDEPMRLPRADLGAHLRRLADILDRTHPAARVSLEETELSKHRRVAAFCVGADLTVTAVNDSARQLLDLSIGDQLRSLPLFEEDRIALMSVLRSQLQGDGQHSPLLRLNMDPVEATDSSRPILVRLRRVDPPRKPPFMVVVTSELRWPEGLTEALKRSFGLTASENDVLMGLTRSLTPREIADRRGRSVETVRAQIKALLQKTETRSQGDLVRLALSSMDVADPPDAEDGARVRLNGGGTTLKPLPFQYVTRPDGRRVDYLVLGAPTGRAVVYLPGFLGFCRWPARAEAEAARLGLRIIVPIRPGYGASTPLKKSQNRREDVADDIAAIADAEGAARFPMIVMEEDAIYATAFHSAHPDRLSGLIGCAASLPMINLHQYERMGKWHRFFYTSARYTPQLVPFMVRAGFAMVRRGGKRRFLEQVLEKSPSDRRLLKDPTIIEAIETGTEITLDAQFGAVDAFVEEFTIDQVTSSLSALEALQDRVPIHVFHGPDDQRCPPATVDELQRSFPWIEVHRMESGGMLLLFEHWREVLRLIDGLDRHRLPHMGDDA